MPFRIDMHIHTQRHSPCSSIDPARLLQQAERMGLDGIVITEHHYQWTQEEIDRLIGESHVPGLRVWAGFEYTSTQGDFLTFGLPAPAAQAFPLRLQPEDFAARVVEMGGFCIAAHPTRLGLGFDERLMHLPVAAIETHSVNLQEHEQRLAVSLASAIDKPSIAASDAHLIQHVGVYVTEFAMPIQTLADMQGELIQGRFQPSGGQLARPAAR
ncbi:MAG TPA: PHP domain-containing protein [Candidatus Hydrogenedentes bacterium]|nr:PHP domain-containing protein [Candidatus Hydrogenedentota bacterium]HOS02215.1 PHP domain-containing protein [Candidatus Hydrogenedentota bacterium]